MKKLFYFGMGLLLCLFAAIWTGCKDKEEEQPGAVYGVVSDKETGKPIKSAGIELQPIGLKTVTGTDGQYGFNELEPGTYKLYITKSGYADNQSDKVVVKSGQTTKFDAQLEKLPPALRIVNDKAEDIDELDFGAEEDDISRSFTIFNDGKEKLQWQITKTAVWITALSKDAGVLDAGKTQLITVTIDREQLKEGDNIAIVNITSDNGNKSLKVKAVGDEVVGDTRRLPVVKMGDVTDKSIAEGRATLKATIVDTGDPTYTERGFVYATTHNPMLGDEDVTKKVVSGQGSGVYSVNLTDMEMGTVYYVRAYASNEVGTAYGAEAVLDFNAELPIVQTKAVSGITSTTATLTAEIQSFGDPVYTEAGFVYGSMPEPAVDENGVFIETVNATGLGTYKKDIDGLTLGETYYVRAFLRNENYIAYGKAVSFTADYGYVIFQYAGIEWMVQKEDIVSDTKSWVYSDSLCRASTLEGFTDWVLPGLNLLKALYQDQTLIGGFREDHWYWSTKEGIKKGNRYRLNFQNGKEESVPEASSQTPTGIVTCTARGRAVRRVSAYEAY